MTNSNQHREEEDMIDIEKAQQDYVNLAEFSAHVTMWTDAAEDDEEQMIEPIRQLANRLVGKWRRVIAELCLRERIGNGAPAPTRAPAKAKGKGRVEVLTEEEAEA